MIVYLNIPLRDIVEVELADKSRGCILEVADPAVVATLEAKGLVAWKQGQSLAELPAKWKTKDGHACHEIFGFPIVDAEPVKDDDPIVIGDLDEEPVG